MYTNETAWFISTGYFVGILVSRFFLNASVHESNKNVILYLFFSLMTGLDHLYIDCTVYIIKSVSTS